jgi:large subunit ribosomal protein L24
MERIRKGDMVEVLSGNDRGKRGRVLRVARDKGRLVVEGVNVRWKHMRKSQQTPQGGRIQREMPIHECKVMLYDEAAGTRTRVGFQRVDGRKVRMGRKTGKEIGTAAPPERKAAAAPPKAKARKKTAKPKAAGGEE